eukprot:2922739-Alexandrium_andersonii.AAC.1
MNSRCTRPCRGRAASPPGRRQRRCGGPPGAGAAGSPTLWRGAAPACSGSPCNANRNARATTSPPDPCGGTPAPP